VSVPKYLSHRHFDRNIRQIILCGISEENELHIRKRLVSAKEVDHAWLESFAWKAHIKIREPARHTAEHVDLQKLKDGRLADLVIRRNGVIGEFF